MKTAMRAEVLDPAYSGSSCPLANRCGSARVLSLLSMLIFYAPCTAPSIRGAFHWSYIYVGGWLGVSFSNLQHAAPRVRFFSTPLPTRSSFSSRLQVRFTTIVCEGTEKSMRNTAGRKSATVGTWALDATCHVLQVITRLRSRLTTPRSQ